ncbi:MAG TPA: hypothetical protein VMK12_28645, partial [Anaeromyxobacteraceae bacterium]|nr:hypothetical protein [Anaeromyxobacteraceae bacterium]
LSVKSMSKSARGTVEKPGRNVRAKSGLNRSILDQGWGELRRQLEYKLAWPGARPLLRRAVSSEQDDPASVVGFPHSPPRVPVSSLANSLSRFLRRSIAKWDWKGVLGGPNCFAASSGRRHRVSANRAKPKELHIEPRGRYRFPP